MQLCDTNILSELTRREPNAGVLAWAQQTQILAISVVTLDEILYGLAWRPIPRIIAWFDQFFDRRCTILPVTEQIARVSGQLRGELQSRGETRTQADMMIAATAKVHGLVLVTHNVRDFELCGAPVLNPFL